MKALRTSALVGLGLGLLIASPAKAAGSAPPSTAASGTQSSAPKKRVEQFKKPSTTCTTPTPQAKERFNRAIELFNSGNYDASMLEFRRAYQLCPSYRILYNVALVNVQINDYAQALKYFQRYLDEGGKDVPDDRRQEVEKRIEQMKNRIALVTIQSNVPNASVSVDDLQIASSVPSGPIQVNEGIRHITLSAPGRLPSTQVVELAGRDKVTLHFDLRKPLPPGGQAAAQGSSFPWPAWVGTGVLAAGATVTGVLALGAHSTLNNDKNTFDPTVNATTKQQQLQSDESKQKNLALATDIVGGAAIVMAGISLYLTLKHPSSSEGQEEQGSTIRLGVSGQGASVSGTF